MDQADPQPATGSARPNTPAPAGVGPRLLTGCVFSAILGEDGPERAALLHATIAALGHLGVRLVRVGNPLRTPLTLERMLIQIGAGEDGVPPAEEVASVVEALRARGDESRVVLVIEQAETLDARALVHLQSMSDAFEVADPAVRVLFVGSPAFLTVLERAGAQRIRSEVAAGWAGEIPVELAAPEGDVALAPSPDQATSASCPDALRAADHLRARQALHGLVVDGKTAVARGLARRRWILALAVASVLGIVAGAVVLGSGNLPRAPSPSDGAGAAGSQPLQATEIAPRTGQAGASQMPAPEDDRPTPRSSQAAGPVPLAAAPPGSTQPPLSAYEAQRARLQREFDAFLDASGRSTSRLDAAQRQALFEEFLDWRARNPGGTVNGAPASPASRVVVYHRAGSPAGEAQAGRVAEALRPDVNGVEVRSLDGDPSAAPTVRFFYPEDEAAAREVIRSMQALDLGLDWRTRDSSKNPLKPPPGTVEVWLPTR